MLTTQGKTLVKRYLSGLAPSFIQTIGVGIGNTAAQSSDTRLEFETQRYPVLISYITNSDKLIFKASIPEELSGVIYECGIFSYDTNPQSGVFSGQNIAFFTESENWSTNSGSLTYSATDSRWGNQTISQAPDTEYFLNTQLDLSGYSIDDQFLIAGKLVMPGSTSITSYTITGNTNATLTSNGHSFQVGDNVLIANVASTVNGIRTVSAKDTNTFTVTIPSATNIGATAVSGTALPHCKANVIFKTSGKQIQYSVDMNSTNGYLIKNFDKADNATYVDFDWGLIETVVITFTGRGAVFYWDALKVIDSDINDPNLVMIGRIVPATPITKEAGVPLEIQYEMNIGIS